jgi:hypothetical protein
MLARRLTRIVTLVFMVALIGGSIHSWLSSGPHVWATWGGRTIEVRGQAITLLADRPDRAEIEVGDYKVLLTPLSVRVNDVEKPVPGFTKVLVETAPALSVHLDGKLVFP